MTAQALRYPPASLWGDYARAGAGLAMTALPLAALEVSSWLAVPLAACAVLFALFAARTAQRHLTRVTVDAAGVRADGPLGAAVRWDELRRLRLRFYSTRRDRSQGWMQMTLAGDSGRVKLESTLDGFDAIAARAAAAARRNGLTLDPATVDNLLALGIDPEMPEEEG
ncbi:hypothetical protein [Azospirillum halopraeferens]|uniref:hypothetical protein n=1 Tax=Azospirillum halopraeferens TaxID=34010 RepID=UPI0003F6841F|nr:hypothetical protein [Azospirillum halopraeferens]